MPEYGNFWVICLPIVLIYVCRIGGLELGDGLTFSQNLALVGAKLQQHVFTQYRPVRKYNQQDLKARKLNHQLNVWPRGNWFSFGTRTMGGMVGT